MLNRNNSQEKSGTFSIHHGEQQQKTAAADLKPLLTAQTGRQFFTPAKTLIDTRAIIQ
jgi:hypothetical protein